MRFDTQEAFSKAMRARLEHRGPADLTSEFRRVEQEGVFNPTTRRSESGRGVADRFLTTTFVRMERAAFEVHDRAMAQIGPGDDLLGFRVEQAEMNLPEGWQLAIHIEGGSAKVLLIAPGGEQQHVEGASLSGAVADALSAALKAAKS